MTKKLRGLTAAPLNVRILLAAADKSYRTITVFMEELRKLRCSTRVFERPTLLFTETLCVIGDAEELNYLDQNALTRWMIAFHHLNGFTEAEVAELFLRDEASSFRSAMMIGIALGVRSALGPNDHRDDVVFECMDQFSALSHELMNCEA